MTDPADTLKEPDLLQRIIELFRAEAPQLPAETIHRVESMAREEMGGLRVRIAKRRPHLSAAERHALRADVLGQATDAELTERYRISRATLYRHLKR